MSSVILYCKRTECGKGFASVGEIPAICPACEQPTKWSTTPPRHGATTEAALVLTENDRRMLRSFRIDPE